MAEAMQHRAVVSDRKSPPAPYLLSDDPVQRFQCLSEQPGQLSSSSQTLPYPLALIHWRRNIVVVSSNLPKRPSPTTRFQICSQGAP